MEMHYSEFAHILYDVATYGMGFHSMFIRYLCLCK